MKRLLSFVLSFAMVFTMFAPSAYAMETAEDYSVAPLSLEYVAYQKNGEGELEWDGSSPVAFAYEDTALVYVTDGESVIPTEQVSFAGDKYVGLNAYPNDSGYVELSFTEDAAGGQYAMILYAGEQWYEFAFTLPEESTDAETPGTSDGVIDISNLTIYLEYADQLVKASDTLSGTYFTVPKGETFALYAVDSNGNYITSASQIEYVGADYISDIEVGYTSADSDTKLYTTIGIPNNDSTGLGSQGFSIGYTDGSTTKYYSFNVEVSAAAETTTAVFFNVNGTGWQQYTEGETKYFEPYDIVQVYVMYNGTHIPVNTAQFTSDGMNYGSYNGYFDHDADGMYQTLYFTPETAEGWLDNQLYMESLSAPGEAFTFDFRVQDVTKELSTASNFYFEYSGNGVYYEPYNSETGINVTPGGRVYLRLVGPDGYIYGEESMLFNTIENPDDINITYTAGDRWCIDAGSSFTGSDTIYVVHNWAIYGDVVINVTAAETETGYSDINIIKDGTTTVYDSTPVQVAQDGYFDIAFLDSNGQRIATDYVTISEEGKAVLEQDNITLGRKSDRIRITPSTETPEGTYTAYFTVRDQYAEVEFTVKGSGSEEDYENMEGVPTEKFYGTVNWRVSGETEWQTASVGDFVTPEGAIVLDLYEVLEIQFIDESGNKVSNISYPRGRQEGQTGYGLYNQTEGAHSALTNSSTAMMREGGNIVTHIDVNGYHYVLRYLLQEPYIGEPTAEFDGFAMAVTTNADGEQVYESFDEFLPVAQQYNRFGIQFFDANGNLVDSSRVQFMNNSYDGFDLTHVTDRDGENAQWIYENWEVVFNSNAQGGTFGLEFLIDGTYITAVTFNAEGNGSGSADELYCWWDWNFDEEQFYISTMGKTSIGIRAEYDTDNFYSSVLFGAVDEETGEFVPYDEPSTGIDITYNDNGMPVVAEFDGAEIAAAYPEDYARGYIHTAIVIYDSQGNGVTMSGADFVFTNEAISQFDYWLEENDGILEIYNGPAMLNAAVMEEEFGDIAKNITRIIIYGSEDYSRSAITHIEGAEVLAAFPNVVEMNVYGVGTIDSGAFRNMSKLEFVHVLNTRSMGDGVFENCSILSSVNLSYVESIGINTFKGCPNLRTAGTLNYGYFNVAVENSWDWEAETLTLPANIFSGSSIKEVYISEYTHIGENAFGGLSLDKVYFGDSVRVINNAFNNATVNTLYTAEDRDYFFANTQITGSFSYNVHIPNYVYEITWGYAGEYLGDWQWDDNIIWTLYSDGQMIFEGEGPMGDPQIWEEIYYEWDEETQTEVEKTYYYNESDWAWWPAVKKIVISDGITSISDKAFYSMYTVDKVVIADSVTSIGADAFAGCEFIYSVVIPNSVTMLGDNAFGENTQVQSVWYAGTQTQWNSLVANTSQPAFEYEGCYVHCNAAATFVLDDRFVQAGIKLRVAGSSDEGAYEITVPAGTQMEFVVPSNATLENVVVNGEIAHNNTFIATSGEGWIDANVGISNIIDEGKLNTNINWVLDGDTLIIYGKGAMPNYTANTGAAPWSEYTDSICQIIIEEGITAIGNANFENLVNLGYISFPSTLTKIGDNNFIAAFSLENVMFNEGLVSIGNSSFKDAALVSIFFPSTLTTIGRESFNNTNITSLYIPAKLTSIGEYALDVNSSLETIEVAEENTVYSAVNNLLMDKAGKTLIKVPAKLAVDDGVLELPNTLKTINNNAFATNSTIRELIVPDSVTTLKHAAFTNMWALESITIGNGVKEIPMYAFTSNYNLRTINLGENVSKIGAGIVSNCELIENITFRGDNPKFKFENGMLLSADGKTLYAATMGAVTMYPDSEYGYIVVPYGVETIFEVAFENNNRIEAVQLPVTVKTIQSKAFQWCSNLYKMIIPASAASIGKDAFRQTGIQEGKGHWVFDDETGSGSWVLDEEGIVYYGGTQAQWNKIKANVNPQNVVFDFDVSGKLVVLNSDFDTTERTKIVKYVSPVTEEIELSIGVSENPITGETAEYIAPVITWDAEKYGDNFKVEESADKQGVYVVTIAAGGTYTFTAYNGDKPADKQTFKYVVAEKATSVSFNQFKGGYTRDGRLVVAAGKTVAPVLKWTGGDNKAWAKGTYTFTYDVICDEEMKQYVTVNQTNGKVTVAKDAPKFDFTVTYLAYADNDTMGEGCTVYAEYPMQAVTKLVDKVLVTNENEGFVNLPIGSKVVLDQTAGITSFTFRANASNDGWAYNEFEFTAPVSQNFTVVDNGDNTATVTLLGGTGSVVVTAKALDGSNKTAKVTFTTGTAVKELNIATTMAVTPVDFGDGDVINYIALAKGKSTTLTADILPSTATNKAVTWQILGNPEVATVANGKVTAKAPGEVRVRAVAQDGSGAVAVIGVQVFEAAAKVQMNGVEGFTDGKVLLGEEPATFTIDALPVRNVLDENGKVIKDRFTDADVFSEVSWAISGGIANYVKYETVDAEYDDNGNFIAPAYAVFTADRAGTFNVKATANDGSGKSATFKVTVAQVPYAMSLTAPKGAGRYTTADGTEAWIVKGDTAKGITVKPAAVFNNADKQDAVKAPYNTYKLYLNGEEVSGTSVKLTAAGLYTLKAVADSGNAETEVVLDIREKSAIDLESLEIKLPSTIGEEYHNVQYAVAGKEFEISRYLNGTLASKIDTGKIDVVWNVTDSSGNPVENMVVTKSNGKSYLDLKAIKEYRGGHSITLTLTDKSDPENTVTSNQLNVVVVEPLGNNAVWFGISEENSTDGFANAIQDMDKTVLNPRAETTSMTVNHASEAYYQYCQNFEVKSSNPKVLKIEKTDRDTFDVTPLDDGKVTVTITALDGSGKKFTIKNVVVHPVDSPVNKITVGGTSYSVNPEQSIVVEYGLVSKTGKPDVVTEVSSTDMEWTSSDERIATVENLGIYDTTSVTDKKGNVTYTTSGKLAIHPTDKTGKVTITGKALDGSGKTVKITVTVAKDSATQQLSLNVPANAANGGQTDGTVVLGWGKSLKLTATLKPNKAKNKTVTYQIEAVDAKDSDNVTMTEEQLAELGVTINKSGTVTTKAPSKAMPTPYTGWVKVTATLNYQLLEAGVASDVDAVQYIYIERPMTKMRLTAVNNKGKVVAVTGETIKKDAIDGNPMVISLTDTYTHEVTYRGYSAKVDGVMTDFTTAEPVYSAKDNLLWTTNNPALATVDRYGNVTVNSYTKAGTVTITAAAQDGSNVKMTYKITVKAK